MAIRLVQAGVTLINFSTVAEYNIERFDPGVPEHRDERVASVYQDGEEVLYLRYKNAMATMRLLALDDTAPNVNALVEDISEVLADIKALRGTGGEPIYIHFHTAGGNEYRSEVFVARIIQSDDRLSESYERASKQGTTDSLFRRITIVFERAPWWEEDSLTELSLANGHGSGTGGVEVRNSNDSANDNYVQITGSAVIGTERTPLKIEVQRDVLGTDRARKVHISRNGRYTPNSAKIEYEFENATAFYGNHTTPSDTKFSNGTAKRWSPLSATYDFNILYGSVSGANMAIYRGRWFHVLVTADNLTGTARIRYALELGGDDIASTDWYDITEVGVHDIGAVKIPPSYLGNIAHMPLIYRVYMYDPDNASAAVTLDTIYLMPSEQEDGYMTGTMWGTYLGNGSGYIFDGDKRITYGFLAPTPDYMDYVTKTGKYIEVKPGEDCRLIFVWDSFTSGGAPKFASADETYNVRAWFRKRILHI